MKRFLSIAAAFFVSFSAASAQSYPDRVVRLVVPFPAGGSYDVIARLVGAGLGERWGHQVVIDNKGGAAGEIGAAAVASAAPDGYTLLLFGDGILINQGLMKNRAFHPLKNFTPVTLVARSPQVLVASRGLNVSSLAELIKRGKDGKTDLPFGTAGHPGIWPPNSWLRSQACRCVMCLIVAARQRWLISWAITSASLRRASLP